MITYRLAMPKDDATLRTLLQDNGMEGSVVMAMTREPSFFAGMDYFGEDWAVIAEEGAAVVGMYQCSRQNIFINGKVTTVGYLGGLRVAPSYRSRLFVLKEGYKSVIQYSPDSTISDWYTSIASDNHVARRVLEAGLKGMPTYHFLGELVTLAMPVARQQSLKLWQLASPDDYRSLCDFYNAQACQYQLAPVLSPELLVKINLPLYVYRQGDTIQAVMGLWNQQAFKQVIAKRYAYPLNLLRPIYNIFAKVSKRVTLPANNEVFDQTFLAFLAVKDQGNLVALIADALSYCQSQVMTLALDSNHPVLPIITQKFAAFPYQTRLYRVCFDEQIHEWPSAMLQAEASVL